MITTNGTPSSILVVDDDPRNVRLLESILRSQGYEITSAGNGEEALRRVEAGAPDLVLLDVMMPKMSGFELCRRLKGRYETRLLPIIMITALNALEDKVQALELGADDFLSKPINKVELLAKVRAVLRVKALQDEVVRQKRELEASNQELFRTQRYKESLTQMIVHDLKNPLASIMGNIQLVEAQKGTLPPGRLEELLRRASDSAGQLMRMILNILHIGRMEEQRMPLRLEAVSLRPVAQEVLDEMASIAQRDGVRLTNTVPADLPAPMADRELVGRILSNLVSNALKHTPPGGEARVEARIDGGTVVLEVSDTGQGIPEDLQPHLFEKFVTGEEQHGRRRIYDSGLGLTFCRLAVDCHGGRIWLASRPGAGTQVFVALPLSGPPRSPAAPAERPTPGPPREGRGEAA
jgi:signal transduction histidine kinase